MRVSQVKVANDESRSLDALASSGTWRGTDRSRVRE